MTQSQLDRAVARATGESVATVRGLGFSLMAAPRPARRRRRRRYRARPVRRAGRG
jgi:hypothetical protein